MNLGSPDSTSVSDVRTYLREFLMDGRVIDVPWPLRAFLVYGCILPFRPKESAHAYRSVWLPEGSPLVVTSHKVTADLGMRLSVPVKLAMRYRNPTVPDALRALRDEGVDEVLLIPLFPHYAMSSFETAVEHVKDHFRVLLPEGKLSVQPPCYQDPDYIDAMVENARAYLARDYDHLLFSFHGIPERQVRKSDPSGNHCLASPRCCEGAHPSHATCYRHQCLKTMELFARKADLDPAKYSVAFQSRLGRDPWLQPPADEEIERLAREGTRKLLVICPAFVSDCLETIEEIGIRGKESFESTGGESLTLIPCMNDHPRWIDALEGMCRTYLSRAD